jgi:catechol 2,3-dioxygenase-like lactoylglutathione lyase family enzyme
MKLEVVVIPVSDVDLAKKFYSRLGWRSTPIAPVTTSA